MQDRFKWRIRNDGFIESPWLCNVLNDSEIKVLAVFLEGIGDFVCLVLRSYSASYGVPDRGRY